MHNHTYRIKKFVKLISTYFNDKDKILDAGAGDAQYKRFFNDLNYISLDCVFHPRLDIISDIENISCKNEYFSAIICIQVLEHLKDPQIVLKEFYRLLKKNGKLFISTHMAFPLHMEPFDYFRFTKYGLAHLAEKSGFKVEFINPQGGICIVISKLLQVLVPKLLNDNKYLSIIYYIIFSVPIFVINLILFLLDFLDRKKSITLNYECYFIKL